MQDERTEPSVSLGGPSSEEQQLLSEDQHEQTAAESPAALAPGGKDVLRDQAGHESVTLTDLKTQEARSRTGDAAGRASSPVTSAPASPLDTPRATAADATSSSLSQASDREQQTQSSRDAAVATSFSESSSEVPVVVGNPYRRRNSKHAKPKSILKPPPPPQAKFSFRRDVLGYVVGEAAPLQSLNPINTASNLSNSQPSKSVASSADPSPTSTATAPEQSESNEIPRHRATAPASVPQPGAAPARSNTGGLWKRLGGAVTAVAGSVPVPQNAVKTLNSITSAVRSSPTLEAARSGTTGPDNAQTASGRASHYVQPRATDSLKADYVKSVRFTMSSLSVVYPINGPGPPGVEAETRKRINKEHLARQENREKKDGWTNLDLLDLYEECCRTREEPGIAPLRTLLMVGPHPKSKEGTPKADCLPEHFFATEGH